MVIRKFTAADARKTSEMIAHTLRTVNSKDYSPQFIEETIAQLTPPILIERRESSHMYVICDGEKIIACGAIAGFWGSESESILLTIFVHPDWQGKGVGRKLIETLEKDEFFLNAKRIEIPASITAVEFYKKMGYDYKNGIAELDDEQLYRLEKYR